MSSPAGWSDLTPDAALLNALDSTGEPVEGKLREWSKTFADRCAEAVAEPARRDRRMAKRLVLPDPAAGRRAEPLRAFGGSKKRIDVVVAQELVGLEIGVSLKGMNFDSGGNYPHNLTGRLYELADEMAVVHRVPSACVHGRCLLPTHSCCVRQGEGGVVVC